MRAVLTYHSIDDSGSPISVSPEAFAGHVQWLASGRVPALRDLLNDTVTDGVAITFDDGFANFATDAWPLLRAHGLPATVFVVTQRVGKTNAWRGVSAPGIPTLPLMNWETLDRVRAEGVEFGGHTRNHRLLVGLGAADTVDEVAGCAHDLNNRYGEMPATFAYPFGAAPDSARAIAKKLYACACTTEYRLLAPGEKPEAVPRVDMFYFRTPTALSGWGSPLFKAQIVGRRAVRAVGTTVRAVRDLRRRQ
jgi:peptidoglycan/xylan/chitin deacetylase (PgdA/CDA1 family)